MRKVHKCCDGDKLALADAVLRLVEEKACASARIGDLHARIAELERQLAVERGLCEQYARDWSIRSCDQLDANIQLAEAVAVEREECAAIAELWALHKDWLGDPSMGLVDIARKIAAAIRARTHPGDRQSRRAAANNEGG